MFRQKIIAIHLWKKNESIYDKYFVLPTEIWLLLAGISNSSTILKQLLINI